MGIFVKDFMKRVKDGKIEFQIKYLKIWQLFSTWEYKNPFPGRTGMESFASHGVLSKFCAVSDIFKQKWTLLAKAYLESVSVLWN